MNKNFFEILGDIIAYIFSIPLTSIPTYILMALAVGAIGCGAALCIIGFPVSVWEHFAGKKVNSEKENKVITIVSVCFSIALFLQYVYERIY